MTSEGVTLLPALKSEKGVAAQQQYSRWGKGLGKKRPTFLGEVGDRGSQSLPSAVATVPHHVS